MRNIPAVMYVSGSIRRVNRRYTRIPTTTDGPFQPHTARTTPVRYIAACLRNSACRIRTDPAAG